MNESGSNGGRGALSAGERMVVETFRRRLGPGQPPRVPGLEVSFVYAPLGHEAPMYGGDFLDFASGRNLQQLAVVVGDIPGKGVEAAAEALVAKIATRTIVRGLRWPPLPGAALTEVHNALLDNELREGTHVTMVFALVSARDGTVAFASAGHPAPYVLRHDRVEQPMAFVMPAIGVTWEAELQPYPTETFTLDEGEAVLLYTDGIAEARDAAGELYEERRMVEALEELRGLPAAELLERLLADATRFAGAPPPDDVTLVLVGRCAPVA